VAATPAGDRARAHAPAAANHNHRRPTQTTQDLLERGPAELNTGCDSSDCLLCQGQRQFCNECITNSSCTWLGQRWPPPAFAGAPAGGSWGVTQDAAGAVAGAGAPQPAACARTAPHPPASAASSSSSGSTQVRASSQQVEKPAAQPQQQRAADDEQQQQLLRLGKRARRSSLSLDDSQQGECDDDSDALRPPTAAPLPPLPRTPQPEQQPGVGAPQQPSPDHHPQQLQQAAARGSSAAPPPAPRLTRVVSRSTLLPEGASCWQWRPDFAGSPQPAPARLAEVARLQSASDASGGRVGRSCDRVSGLEFSADGQLLAAAGVSKQVAMYSLAALSGGAADDWTGRAGAAGAGAAAAAAAAAGGASGGPAAAQRRARRQAQLSAALPCLPPVATVRLPGKVSSIAFSPDMQGVVSVGDYDGTLTQVHVASGHYLSEVDAHAGRRIWAVTHSRLRRHLAATASDDCTAKLWAGSGLSTCVAAITLPARPAVCGADFCASHDSLLCLAAADARVYLYDLRALARPLAVLAGHHGRPVSYAKFLGPQQLVSAGIDGSLALWDLAPALGGGGSTCSADAGAQLLAVQHSQQLLQQQGSGSMAAPAAPASSTGSSATARQAQQQQQQQQQQQPGAPVASRSGRASDGSCSTQTASTDCGSAAAAGAGGAAAGAAAGEPPAAPAKAAHPWRVFKGHRNEKNFVGLAVDAASGLLAVGSESSEVFTYHTSWSSPLARFDMEAQQQQQQHQQRLELQQQLQQPVAHSWAAAQQQQQRQSVSAVAWQPASSGSSSSSSSNSMLGGAGGGRCLAPASLLAAATSQGECRLLSLLS
jgi:WD40 repeat protein